MVDAWVAFAVFLFPQPAETPMDLKPMYRCVAALDVHQAKLTVCSLYESGAGEPRVELREFGGFKRDRRAMAEWIAGFQPEEVVMESTGIDWKTPYAALERLGIRALVVNARHVNLERRIARFSRQTQGRQETQEQSLRATDPV
jgi:transposase